MTAAAVRAAGPPPLLCAVNEPPRLNAVHNIDALELLKRMPSQSVNCIVTSPPYFGLRDYGVPGQIGLEETPQAYVATLVELFREARRVLRDDGTCWINMGDTYTGGGRGGNPPLSAYWKQGTNAGSVIENRTDVDGLPSKSLLGMPWRLAFALQDDGWILRADIIWHKPNPMPESVTDRPTKSHEYVFLLTKSGRYWYDADAIREPIKTESFQRAQRGVSENHKNTQAHVPGQSPHSMHQARANGEGYQLPENRNKRSVWTVNTEPTPEAHFATFPTKLIEPMILAGCPDKVCCKCGAPWIHDVEATGGTIGKSWHDHSDDLGKGMSQTKKSLDQATGYRRLDRGYKPTCECNADTRPGVVYDPFMGSGTTALVARRHGRNYIGSELNAEYVAIARERLRMPFDDRQVVKSDTLDDLPLFAQKPA